MIASLAFLLSTTAYAEETRDARVEFYNNQSGVSLPGAGYPGLKVKLSGGEYVCSYSTNSSVKLDVLDNGVVCHDAPTGVLLTLNVTYSPSTGPRASFTCTYKLGPKSRLDLFDAGGFLVKLTYVGKENFEVSYDP
jgi:hypothetical protein